MARQKPESCLARGNKLLREGRVDDAIFVYEQGIVGENPVSRQLCENVKLAKLRKSIYGSSGGANKSPGRSPRRQSVADKETHPDNISIDIIVPVFNALEYTKRCLGSVLQNHDGLHIRLIIVNDGSDQATTSWLRAFEENTAGVEVIENQVNLGYTKAVNVGMVASQGDFLVILNSDTVVTPGWLRNLLRCMLSDASIGLVGPLSNAASWQSVPKAKNSDGSLCANQLPKTVSPDMLALLIAAESNRDYPRVRFLNGFCLMMSRSVLDEVGLLDESAFPRGYGEENDFCLRAFAQGFELAVADDSFVYHAKSKSFGHEHRHLLSKKGGEALRKKHGAAAVRRALEETEQSVRALSRIRKSVADCFDKPRRFDRITKAQPPLEPILLRPDPVIGSAGFNVDPDFGRACLVFPYASEKEHLNQPLGQSVGIHLHLHYLDLLEEFSEHLAAIPVEFDLFVSINDHNGRQDVEWHLTALENVGSLEVEVFANKGRDIAPFVAGFGKKLSKYDIICHIHSKRSPHNFTKRDWRRQLLHNLMGSSSIVRSILDLFSENAKLGLVFPEYHHSLSRQIGWGTNYAACEKLAEHIGLDISPNVMTLFPAGSMFWGRSSALSPLLNSGLEFSDFPEEKGQIDGTPAHAVERLLGEISASKGYDVLQVAADKPHNLKDYHPAKWPYTPPSRDVIEARISAYREKHPHDEKVVVYTAITGSYETPVAHEIYDDNVKYVLYADRKLDDRGFWALKEAPRIARDPLLRARLIKASPDRLFQRSEIAIWVDGNVVLRKSLEQYIDLARRHPEIPIFGIPHPLRNCAYQEAEEVVAAGKAPQHVVDRQMEKYRRKGFPVGQGLIETNLLIFNLEHPRVSDFLAEWRRELEQESRRDQLSINYALWKCGLDWLPIMEEGRSLRDHGGFAYLGHGKNAGIDYEVFERRSREQVVR
jgi:GT2 family glycosyltransferase